MSVPAVTNVDARVRQALKQYWGYDALRPLQAEAIAAGLERRDSLVVLPTGGGKSLCYQIPPLLAGRTDIVVSPLIALMKDQVDGLRANGYPAAAVYSGLSGAERDELERELRGGRLRLLLVAPERLLTPGFLRLVSEANVQSFAIDEAHCISHWGHDFRPEYRRLAELKQHFPHAALHAFTATATQRVRADIVQQLRLRDPRILVGSFDRPNLVYRVIQRRDTGGQVIDTLARHKGQAAIVYCISRRDTEALAGTLRMAGLRAAHYHAGMSAEARRHTQDAFAREQLDVIVATVAFGMGIDRSDVRCVIHAAMPKSVEHYQQESGRAGRDGLEAECVLLYSPADAMKWENLIFKSAAQAGADSAVVKAMLELLGHMRMYAGGVDCRHASLVRYFGQAYEPPGGKDGTAPGCGACDVCLGEIPDVEDATVLAQKILSCVARVQERWGAGHVTDVLKGACTERVRECRHDQLSTYGLLRDMDKAEIKGRIYDLLDQGLLARGGDGLPVLKLNAASWQVMRGQRRVMLRKSERRTVSATRVEADSWEGVDRGLYDALRAWRREIAEARGVPAFVVFSDATLRDLARRRPVTPAQLRRVHGVGAVKAGEYGDAVIACVQGYCRAHGIPVGSADPAADDHDERPERPRARTMKPAVLLRAFEMFADGADIEEVMRVSQRARRTVAGYLAQYIAERAPGSLDRWVDPATYGRVRAAAERHGTRFLRPIFDALDGQVPYDTIRLVCAHIDAQAAARHDEIPQPRT